MPRFHEIHRTEHLPDKIASEILASINRGEFSPGDSLPTEHKLADSFGVSRNVVREAIARLRSDGVVESRQGRGAIVRPLSMRETFRVDVSMLGDLENLADLFELRRLLEIEAAGLAAKRRSESDLEQIEDALSKMEGHGEFDDLRLEADADFHRSIGQAAGNGFLSTIIDYISSRLKDTITATSDIYTEGDLIEVTLSEHREILRAIQAQDLECARKAMARHLEGAAARLNVPIKDKLKGK